jgi:hypothetical protein
LSRENQGEGSNQTALNRRKAALFLKRLAKYSRHIARLCFVGRF